MGLSEILSYVLSGDQHWDALDQSRFNSLMLAIVVLLVGFALRVVKRMAKDYMTSIREDIKEGHDLARAALEEIRKLAMKEVQHDTEIEHLKEDVRNLTGKRTRR